MLMEFHLKTNKKIKIVSFLLFLICIFIYYFLNKYIGFEIKCFIHALTGYYCPGCGITRMFFSIIELDLYQAFRYNPLIFILLILSIIYLIINKFIKKIVIKKNFLIILLIIIILFGILRNIDLFSYLKPTNV